MTEGKKRQWLLACAAIGAVAVAAQARFGGSAALADAAWLVTLPDAAPTQQVAARAPTAQPATLTSHIVTIGGYTYDWTALQAAIDADSEVPSGHFIVGNATDPDYLFAYEKGSFGIDRVTPLASASKWFIGTLAMRMVEAGIVGLDDPMRPPLAFWTTNIANTKSQIQLKHALSMTSGFNGSPLVGGCQLQPAQLLYNCAKNIHDLRYDILRPGNAPGAQFSYGPHGLQVAGAYLEAADTSIAPGVTPARQRNFLELFSQHITTPLGMTNTSWYDPAGSAPTNPWVAGGAYSTPRDYAKLLRAFLGGSFITGMTAFTQPRTTGLTRIFVPSGASGWDYALGSFVECDTPSACATSAINSSPGAYGWTGWIDRGTGYYGLIATEISSGGDRKGVELEQEMQDLIETAIANRVPAP